MTKVFSDDTFSLQRREGFLLSSSLFSSRLSSISIWSDLLAREGEHGKRGESPSEQCLSPETISKLL